MAAKNGWTSHGHPIGEQVHGPGPLWRARCGGTNLCKVCKAEADVIHNGTESALGVK